MKFNGGWLRFACIFVGVSVLLKQVILVSAKLDTNKLERKFIALRKVLQFINERPHQMNLDATFGVTLTEAFILGALQHKNFMFLDGYEQNAVKKIWRLAHDTRKLLVNTVILHNDKMTDKVNAHLTNPIPWMKSITWTSLKPEFQTSKNNLSVEFIAKSFFEGHPNETESDACLEDLVTQCKLTSKCRNIILDYQDSRGYSITHKLLLVQMMESAGCVTSITTDIPFLKKEICSSCLQELEEIEAVSFPSVGRDLASEQMVLCGMEGYLDFLTEHYEQFILDWQHPSGCYSGHGDNTKRNRATKTRFRRESFATDFGCMNHPTGLASAALGLLIRKDIELLI